MKLFLISTRIAAGMAMAYVAALTPGAAVAQAPSPAPAAPATVAPAPPAAPAAAPALSSLVLSPTTVTAGNPSTGTVTLDRPAPAGGISVTLSSNNTAAATVPASITVAADSATATFTVTTLAAPSGSNPTIKATLGGVDKTATLVFGVTEVGNVCKPPEFTVRWVDHSSVELVTKADPPGDFDVVVRELPGTSNRCERKFTPDHPVHATTDGAATAIDLTGFKLLSTGGRIQVHYTARDEKACKARKEGDSPPIIALEKHHLSIDVGVAFGLNGDGSFASHSELALNATSIWTHWTMGVIDLRYSALAAVQQGSDTSKQQATDTSKFNPFTSGGGTFEANAAEFFNLKGDEARIPWLLVFGGVGVRTVPGGQGADVVGRGRLLVGVRVQVLGYNQGTPADSFANTRGYFQIGYARDRFWLQECGTGAPATCVPFDERNRWFAEGQIEIPGIGGKYVRILARAKLDVPVSNNGPSELRISALSAVNPEFFRGMFGGVGAAK